MTLKTFWRYLRSGDLVMLLRLGVLQRAYYRICFLGAAAQGGVLVLLAAEPRSLERLAAELGVADGSYDALQALLDFGVHCGILRSDGSRYALRGKLPAWLADVAHDPAVALLEESFTLHHRIFAESLDRLRERQPFTLADQRGDLIARSSRILEPVVYEAIDALVPPGGALRLFEIGCGSGTYIRHAARRNPQLRALGLDLQDDVAEMARRNMREWGLAERVSIEVGDVRRRSLEPEFDLATMHNNIYYFPVSERIALLAHVRRFLRPGGRLLLTTGCLGGSPQVDILNLWAAMTEGCGRLPSPAEMQEQLAEAGYARVAARSLIPGDRYYAFTAESP